MTAQVLIVGSYIRAVVMDCPRLPGRGETIVGGGYRETHGGKGSNQAVQAARLGAHVRFACQIGADAHGQALRTLLQAEGIGAEALSVHPALPTGIGFIIVDAQGDNQICIDMGAIGDYRPEQLQPEWFAGIQAVLTQLEMPLATALRAMALGRSAGARTIFNPAPACDLRGQDLSAIDYITPNESEARVCLGLDPDVAASDEDLAAGLLDLGVGAVVFTQGAQGARLIARDRDLHQAAHPVSVVDTVGAGDSFNAAFACALAEGQDETAALRFACTCASLATTRPDTIASYHHRAHVEALL